MNKKRIIGILLILAGIIGMIYTNSITGSAIGSSDSSTKWNLISLLGFLIGGIFLLTSKRLEERVPAGTFDDSAYVADALRRSKQGVPAGEFYAQRFIGKLHSEQGYHIHPSYLDRAQYKDAKYFITIEDGYFVAVPHNEGARGGKPPVDISSKSAQKALKTDIYEELKKLLKRGSYRPVPSTNRNGVIRLFRVDEL